MTALKVFAMAFAQYLMGVIATAVIIGFPFWMDYLQGHTSWLK